MSYNRKNELFIQQKLIILNSSANTLCKEANNHFELKLLTNINN